MAQRHGGNAGVDRLEGVAGVGHLHGREARLDHPVRQERPTAGILVDDEHRVTQHGFDPEGQGQRTNDILGMRDVDINGEVRNAIY